jgi:hypothetical protein
MAAYPAYRTCGTAASGESLIRKGENAMSVREAPPQPAPPRSNERTPDRREDPYLAVKARGGEIILTTPTRKAIFLAGLAGAVALALLLTLFALAG